MIFILLLFLIPILVEKAAIRSSFIRSAGVVTFCYLFGILLGNIPSVELPENLILQVIKVVVPLSIPLLLFKSNWDIWKKSGGQMIKAFSLGIISVIIACSVAFYFFQDNLVEAREFSAMMSGIYTGGTMNMSSIGLSLNVSNESFVVLNMAEMLMGGVWLLVLLAFSKRIFSKILPPSKIQITKENPVEFDDKLYWPGSVLSLLVGVAIVGVSIGISFLVAGKISELEVILSVTTLGILASLVKPIKELKGSFGMGNYLLNVFCVGVGSMASIKKLLETNVDILLFVLVIMTITLSLHLFMCKLLKIDVDTFIISSTAGLYGPPFIAPVAKALKNPSIIPIGIAASILGLAIGNYCGLMLFNLLNFLIK